MPHSKTGTNRSAVGRSSVQRVAHKSSLPQQVACWWGEPTTNEDANAAESAPQRTVGVGGRSPAAECNAATLCAHHRKVMAERSSEVERPARVMRKQNQVEQRRRRRATKPAQRVAALRAAAPKKAIADCWRSVATKGKQKYADWASSPINTA